MRINIALGMTPNWFEYGKITIASILNHASESDEYYFYIMANNFEENDIAGFNKLQKLRQFKIEFIKIDDSYFDGAIHDWLGVSSSYRLRLSTLVKESKVLYLDSDIIAIQDVAELYKIDVTDYYLAAVEDKLSFVMKPRINMPPEGDYFNGGVQLINLDKFREDNLEQIIMQKLRESDSYTDQDVINDVCRDKILSLPLKFNLATTMHGYHSRREEFLETLKNPVLAHFTIKPWEESNDPFTKEWFDYKNIIENL